MSKRDDTRQPEGGLNTEIDNRLLPATDYRYAKNGRSGTTDNENAGGCENIRGYTKRDSILPAASEVIVGFAPDIKNNAIILFVYKASLNQNYIKRYFIATGTFENITNPSLMGPVLAFLITTRIYNPRVIDSSFGQLLAWIDYPNGIPNILNIDKMKVGGEYYSTANDSQYIRLAKQPPQTQPSINYYYDATEINYIKDKYFQFRYRYIFDDSQSSVFSPISELSIHTSPYSHMGIIVNSGHNTVKFIEVAVRQGNGVNATDSPEWYIFSIIDKGKEGWANNSFEEVIFNGAELLDPVPRIDSDKLFESVPITADCLEVVSNNRIVLASITEGYDAPALNTTLTPTYVTTRIINFFISGSTIELDNYTTPPSIGDTLYIRAFVSGTFYDSYTELRSVNLVSYPDNLGFLIVDVLNRMGAVYSYNNTTKIVSRLSGGTCVQATTLPVKQQVLSSSTSTVSRSFSSTPSSLVAGINSYVPVFMRVRLIFIAFNAVSTANATIHFNVNGVTSFTRTISVSTSPTSFDIEDWVYAPAGSTVDILLSGPSLINNTTVQSGANYNLYWFPEEIIFPGFKYDSLAEMALVYYDEFLRSSFALDPKTVKFEAFINTPEVQQYEERDPTKGFIPAIAWEVKSLPPIWARYYQWVYKGPSVSSFVQFVVDSYSSTNTSTLIVYLDLYGYEVEVGDEMRLIGFQAEGNPQKFLLYKPETIAQPHFVQAIDTGTKTITTDRGFISEFLGNSVPDSIIIEVRKAKPKTSAIYFEFDQLFEIGNPGLSNRYHKGQTQNQNPSNPVAIPAKGIIQNGGVYFRFRTESNAVWQFDDQNFVFHETFFLRGDPITALWDKGRTNIVNPYGKQQKIGTLIRWSGPLINNTQVNNLSTWDEGNYNNEINARFGDIVGMREQGYTLKIIQQGNYSTAFIGRREVQNADGSTQLVVTDNLIGTINPSESELGTKYPGSIIIAEETLYFFDSIKARWVMVSNNGDHEIAMIKHPVTGQPVQSMLRYWREVSNRIGADSDYEILTGYDYKFGDLYVTIKNRVDNIQESIYYNKDQDRWKFYMDMEYNVSPNPKLILDWYAGVGQSFFGCMAGSLWEFNSLENAGNPVYSSLFRYNPETDPANEFIIETIGMLEPDKVKVFVTHAIHANRAISLVEFFIPESAMYPNGMYSVLKPANYSYREGVYYANIKGDMYTFGIPANDDAKRRAIATGRSMRGHVIKVRIHFQTLEYVRLFSETVGMIPSEKS